MFFSCEDQDVLQPEAAFQQPTEVISLDIPTVDLSEIDFTVVDGIPSFPDLMEFSKAKVAVTNADEEELRLWTKAKGFQSMFFTYDQWLEDLPDEKPAVDITIPSYVHVEKDRKGGDDFFDVNSYSLINSFLVNSDGEFFIGQGLHKVSKNHHVQVVSGDQSLLARATTTLTTDSSAGIFVDYYDGRTFDMSDIEKAPAESLVQCPYLRTVDSHTGYYLEAEKEINTRVLRGGLTVNLMQVRDRQGAQEISYFTEVYAKNTRYNWPRRRYILANVRVRSLVNFDMLRRPIGAFAPQGSGDVDNISFVEGQSGPADLSSFNRELGIVKLAGLIIDSGVYTREQFRNYQGGSFILDDLRYDIFRGQVRAEWDQTGWRGMQTDVGCR
ncbi:hypothetical protein [Neolewinella antarctica]|uniref:DUF5117 domain-containing protein n=1 Tax=Neolewinella antarctica TaxID=442734 RepID=A0ABX0XC12_9BACT|nr:hypothetical protein [Neolewinella antarctica]NJC26473.1 hypothetical protein [Neolewinella antarctica]